MRQYLVSKSMRMSAVACQENSSCDVTTTLPSSQLLDLCPSQGHMGESRRNSRSDNKGATTTMSVDCSVANDRVVKCGVISSIAVKTLL